MDLGGEGSKRRDRTKQRNLWAMRWGDCRSRNREISSCCVEGVRGTRWSLDSFSRFSRCDGASGNERRRVRGGDR